MSEELKLGLGARVRAARKRACLTQEALASRISKTPESVSNIERGQQLPMLDTLAALAVALDVPLKEFFEDVEAAPVSARRRQLEAELRELVRQLADDILATAVQQVAVLTRTGR